MEKHFINEKHDELYHKFKKLQEQYILLLGGASKKDSENFSLKAYNKTLDKNFSEYNEEDNKNLMLFFYYSEGKKIYDTLQREEKPIYCRILDNSNLLKKVKFKDTKDDPVYNALVELHSKVEKIYETQFEPYNYFKDQTENSSKYEFELNSKKEFIEELIDFLKSRGLVKGHKFPLDTKITEKRYNYLKENLVDSDIESKLAFEEYFISRIPIYPHIKNNFWPAE